MFELARLFISIALFRKGPQDVPYSRFLLVLLFVLNFVIEFATHLIPNLEDQGLDISVLLLYMLLDNIVFIAAVYLIFNLHGRGKRFIQCLTAMFGIDLLISIIFLPINIMLVLAAVNDAGSILVLGSLLYMFLLGWNLIIYMHIFRHGLSVSMLYGGVLSLALFALGIFMANILLPGGTT